MSDGVNRRDFLKILGVSGTAVGLAGCNPFKKPEKIIPYLLPPDDVIPGVAQFYNSSCSECAAGCGITVRTREGRATKVEGNPDHPISQGKLCARGHAMLQSTYNPDRLTGPQLRTGSNTWKPISWDEAMTLASSKLGASRGKNAILTGAVTGSLDALLTQVAGSLGARRVGYEAFGHEALRAANRQVFGIDGLPTYDLGAAKTLISFGADFLETWQSPVELARQFRAQHAAQGTTMGHFVAVEPRLSLTGSNADEWVACAPGTEGTLALGLANAVAALRGGAGSLSGLLSHYDANTVKTVCGVSPERLGKLAAKLAAGPSLALAGGTALATTQGTQTAAAVAILNFVCGNVGTTVKFGPMLNTGSLGTYKDMLDLTAAMKSGAVAGAIVYDTNPAHTLPAAAGFADAFGKLGFSVAFTPYMNETAALASLVLPIHTTLESWGDAMPRDGVINLQQPVMQPVAQMKQTDEDHVQIFPRFDTKPVGDALLALTKTVDAAGGAALPATFEEYLKAHWTTVHAAHGGGASFTAFWNAALEKGGVFVDMPSRGVSLAATASSVAVAGPQFENGAASYALLPYPHSYLYDGRGANKPWLQEIPDPVTKAAWDTWAEMHPKTAEKLGVKMGDAVTLDTGKGKIVCAAYVYPGIREDVIAVPVGQGHTNYGRYANGRGANIAAILPNAVDAASGGFAWMGTKVSVTKGGDNVHLVYTGHEGRQFDREVAEAMTMTAFMAAGAASSIEDKEPTRGSVFAHQEEELGVPKDALPPDVKSLAPTALEAPGIPTRVHRWGMAIDLSSCTGCSACVAACYAENNIGIVGKENMKRGREMSWLRIERYWEGEGEQLETRFLPMMCQHCGDAPCEPVCPVFATYHNPEGLNIQVYNRCVGTRYCQNNCPYRVRAFDYFDYDFPEPLNLQLNPDVTVRTKGVMEKCTFCSQRIREAKDRAQDEKRLVRDGEITPACAQTCPTDAIVFGDLNDKTSKVSQLARLTRSYGVLEELNTKPAVSYLRKVVRDRAQV